MSALSGRTYGPPTTKPRPRHRCRGGLPEPRSRVPAAPDPSQPAPLHALPPGLAVDAKRGPRGDGAAAPAGAARDGRPRLLRGREALRGPRLPLWGRGARLPGWGPVVTVPRPALSIGPR